MLTILIHLTLSSSFIFLYMVQATNIRPILTKYNKAMTLLPEPLPEKPTLGFLGAHLLGWLHAASLLVMVSVVFPTQIPGCGLCTFASLQNISVAALLLPGLWDPCVGSPPTSHCSEATQSHPISTWVENCLAPPLQPSMACSEERQRASAASDNP